jgi:hypothetical protein
LDALNPAFSVLMNPEVTSLDHASQATRIAESRKWFRAALGQGREADVRSIRHGTLFQQIIIRDDEAIISPYLYSANTGFSPCIKIKNGGPGFAAFLHEFELLWNANGAVVELEVPKRVPQPARSRARREQRQSPRTGNGPRRPA